MELRRQIEFGLNDGLIDSLIDSWDYRGSGVTPHIIDSLVALTFYIRTRLAVKITFCRSCKQPSDFMARIRESLSYSDSSTYILNARMGCLDIKDVYSGSIDRNEVFYRDRMSAEKLEIRRQKKQRKG